MGKFFDRVLSKYSDSDFDLQLKARFFTGVCLFNMVIILVTTVSTLIIQHTGYRIDLAILATLTLGFFLIPCALILLIRGYFSWSTHLIAMINQMTVWMIILIDHSHTVARLDTFAFIFCVISLLPLAVNRHKSIFLIYGALNIAFLFIYMLINRPELPIPDYAVMEFLSDTTAAIFISTAVAYSVFAINRAALERAKVEIAERTQAEQTVKMQKKELEAVNSELKTALSRMEQTAAELKAANRRLESTQNDLMATNVLLRESEEKFSKIFHQSPLLIGLMDLRHGRFTDISESLSTLAGYTPQDMVGKTSGELNLWATEEEYRKIKQTFMDGEKLRGEEFVIRDRAGKEHLLYVSSEIISIGQAPHLIIMGVDITDRRRAAEEKAHLEERLRQAQKMEAIGHLAGGIAHDFNNMLSVVFGNIDLLMMDDRLSETTRKRAHHIRDAARRSADLVRQLLAFARKQTIKPKALDINRTLSGMMKILQRLIGENIQLTLIPGEDPGVILMDPSQLDQIMANLMVNARDAIPGVGKITIETRRMEIGEAQCDGHVDFYPGVFVVLSVRDNGEGMDEKTLKQIFEPFFTTKEVGKGSGLGLATVYGIVKQNNGFIQVESEAQKGSVFHIFFPLIKDRAAEQKAPGPVLPPAQGFGTVLIVEDDPSTLDIGQSILEQLGYTVLTAGTPENALSIARSHPGDIDLLLTDVIMPDMNGRELSARISGIKPGIKTLFMSGYTANVIAHHGVLEDGVMFLPKPFTVRELAEKVREARS